MQPHRPISSTRLALSLLLIPRLAARLILLPILIALLALALQLWLVNLAPKNVVPVQRIGEVNLARELVYQSSAPRAEIVICKWISKDQGIEFPPGRACLVGPRDVSFIGIDIENGDNRKFADPAFIERLNGNFDKIHFCKSDCANGAGITVSGDFNNPEVRVEGFSNLLLLSDSISARTDTIHQAFTLAGRKLLNLPGLDSPIVLTGLERQIARLLSLVMLIICCVWLSLRAHRRVLEYFASGGSLLPLAASVGPKKLYSALWVISGIRLFAFFAVTAPMIVALVVSGMMPIAGLNHTPGSPYANVGLGAVWFGAVTASLVLTTLCASIADLKRRFVTAVMWRILPLAAVGFGAMVWLLTLAEATSSGVVLRNFIVATPLIGLAPLVASSIIQPPSYLIGIHAVLATLSALWVARRNARWFGSNLEEA